MASLRLRVIRPALLAALLIAGLCFGCSEGEPPAATADPTAFNSASPELKAQWEKATAAAKSKDWFTAVSTFRSLQARPDLSEEQRTLVNNASTEVNDELSAAAEKGDTAALNAIQQLRQELR